MSLRDEFMSEEEKRHSYDAEDIATDLILNLSEMEVPVGELSLDPQEFSPNGKSLKEMNEAAARVKGAPTVFNVGDEDFDIHYRRYKNPNGDLDPVTAATHFSSIIAVIISDVKFMERIKSVSGNNHNPHSAADQVIGTMLVGLANVFYRAAGVNISLTKDILDPSKLFALNRSVTTGTVDVVRSPQFEVLQTVDEIDSTTSLALDVFMGRPYGTKGLNGIVDRDLDLLGTHFIAIITGMLDSIDDAVTLSALRAEIHDPKWTDRELDLIVHLDAIKYSDVLEATKSRMKSRLGGLSIKLMESLLDLSLLNVDYGESPFVSGVPKAFLHTAAGTFNEIFSNYAMVMASAINGGHPMGDTTRVPARDIMIAYIRNRVQYDSIISGKELTDEYFKSRVESRVLNRALHKFWKDDTFHSRLIRHSMGSMYTSRYKGSIEIIISLADSKPQFMTMSNSLNPADLYGGSSEYEVPNPTPVTENKPTDYPKPRDSSIQEEGSMKMAKSILHNSPRAAKMLLQTEGPLAKNMGMPIEFIRMNSTRNAVRLGHAVFMAEKKANEVTLSEIKSDKKIGVMENDKFIFSDDILGTFYSVASRHAPTETKLLKDNSVLLRTPLDHNRHLLTVALSDEVACMHNEVVEWIVTDSIRDNRVSLFNNVWDISAQNIEVLPRDKGIMIDGEIIDSSRTGSETTSAEYYNDPTPYNWISMVNSVGDKTHILDEVNLSPCPSSLVCRFLPKDVYDEYYIRSMYIDDFAITVMPMEFITELSDTISDMVILDDSINLDNTEDVAVFGMNRKDGSSQLYVTKIVTIESNGTRITEDNDSFFGEAEIKDSDVGFEESLDVGASKGLSVPRDHPSVGSNLSEGVDREQNGLLNSWDDDHVLEHHINMEQILDEVLDEPSVDTTVDESEPTMGDDENIADNGDDSTDEASVDDDDLPVIDSSNVISMFSKRGDRVFPTPKEVVLSSEDAAKGAGTIYSDSVISLNRDIELPDEHTMDGLLNDFSSEHMGDINFREVSVDGEFCLEVDSMDETAEFMVTLIKGLGTSTSDGVDLTYVTGHSWIVSTRLNVSSGGMIIHILDRYDADQVATFDIAGEGNMGSIDISELIENMDECLPDEFPFVAHDIQPVPKSIIGLSDVTLATLNNLRRQANATCSELEYGEKIKIIELMRLIGTCSDIPRRLTRNLLTHCVNKVVSISSKHYNGAMPLGLGTGREALATYISSTWDSIAMSRGERAAHAYFRDIEDIDILDNTEITVVVVDMLSEQIGLEPNMGNVPVESLPLDTSLIENGNCVLTMDSVLLTYNCGDDIARPNLSRTGY